MNRPLGFLVMDMKLRSRAASLINSLGNIWGFKATAWSGHQKDTREGGFYTQYTIASFSFVVHHVPGFPCFFVSISPFFYCFSLDVYTWYEWSKFSFSAVTADPIAFSISTASSSLTINPPPPHPLSLLASMSSSRKWNPRAASFGSLIPPCSPSHHHALAKRTSCSSSLMVIPQWSPHFPSAPVFILSSLSEDPPPRPLRSKYPIEAWCHLIKCETHWEHARALVDFLQT